MNFREDRKEIIGCIIVLTISLSWFTYECTKQPFEFPFEPFLGFIPALLGLLYFFNKNNKNAQKKSVELNVIPDRLTQYFVGRVTDIQKIHAMLFTNNRNVVIKGVGGLGKTSVAQKYIEKYRSYFDHIVYIHVLLPPEQDAISDNDFVDKIMQAFTNDRVLKQNLNITLDEKALDPDVFQEICRQLTQVDGTKNLLVIDNAGTPLARFIDQLPKRPNWHILTTARHDIEGFDSYPLSILPPKEAETLFQNHYKTPIQDYATLEKIFKAVDYLTVAIELLAKTAHAADWTLPQLWERVEKHALGFEDAVKISGNKSHTTKTIAEHIIERFVLQELDAEGKKYLLAFAVLPSSPITFEQISEWLQIEDTQIRDFKDVLNDLDRKGWLEKKKNTAPHSRGEANGIKGVAYYVCHPIIQFAVKAQIKPDVDNCAVVIKSFLRLLDVDTAKGEHGIFKKELLPYGETLFKAVYAKNTEWEKKHRDLAILADRLGWIYRALGYFDKSLEYRLIGVTIDEKILEPNDADLATSYNNLALTYGALGDHQKRLEYNLKDLAICEAVLDKQHPNLAASYNNIAVTYSALGDIEKDLEFSLKALAIWEAVLDKQHPDLALSYNNIAVTYSALGDIEKDLEFSLKALAIQEAVLDKQHPSLALSYHNIAATYYDLKDYKKAKFYIDKAVAIRQAVLPATHPDITVSLEWQEGINKALRG